MKKFFLTLVVMLMSLNAIDSMAQSIFSNKEYDGGHQAREAYLQGAVPEVDGKVVFTKSIDAAGMNKADIYLRLTNWASLRYNPSTERGKWNDVNYFKNSEYARILKASAEDGTLKIQGNEDMVFTNKTLAKDMAVVSYILNVVMTDGKADVTIDNISYTYNLTENAERIEADDWITDKEAFTKSGKFNKGSGKFRVKTVDLVTELFAEIEEALK